MVWCEVGRFFGRLVSIDRTMTMLDWTHTQYGQCVVWWYTICI